MCPTRHRRGLSSSMTKRPKTPVHPDIGTVQYVVQYFFTTRKRRSRHTVRQISISNNADKKHTTYVDVRLIHEAVLERMLCQTTSTLLYCLSKTRFPPAPQACVASTDRNRDRSTPSLHLRPYHTSGLTDKETAEQLPIGLGAAYGLAIRRSQAGSIYTFRLPQPVFACPVSGRDSFLCRIAGDRLNLVRIIL